MYSINTRGSTGSSLSAQLSMARDALMAHQNDMGTISHNVANVNTLGYHRQRTILGARAGMPGVNGMYGAGVDVIAIERAQVGFISRQERVDASLTGRWSAERDQMMRVEQALNEIGEYGIGSSLDAFWNSWEDLANDTDSTAARTEVMNKASDLGYAFATTYGNVNAQRESINVEMQSQVGQINLISSRISNLNQQITNLMRSGQTPNDLLDQREMLLTDLASLANINVEYEEGGSANVYLGSEELVHRETQRDLSWTESAGNTQGISGGFISWADNDKEVKFASGVIYGLMESRDEIGNLLDDLDELADVIRTQVNNVHVEGIGHDESTGNVFFRDDVSGARSLEVSEIILDNVEKISASRKSASGANDLAHEINELQFATPFGSSMTINGKYQTIVSDIGSIAQNADLRYESSVAAFQQILNLQQEYTGVNLDEEMSAMITSQYAFSAASKVLNVVEEMMNTVINALG
jgi:flagellar hook-associated protein 1